MSAQSSVFKVSPAFCDPRADLLVRSADGVDFRVYDVLLSLGSAVFRDMLDHSPPDSSAQEAVVPWPEPAAVIDRLLHYIYPFVKPTLDSLDDIITLIRAADKWQIELALWMLRQDLISCRFLDVYPLRIYAFACEMGFEAEMALSAPHAYLEDPCDPKHREQLEGMSALDLLRLVKMRTEPNRAFDECFSSYRKEEALVAAETDTNIPDVRFRRPEADLVIKSSDGVEFRVFSLFMTEASPKLAALVTEAKSKADDPGYLSLSWPERAKTIQVLLEHIYPIPGPGLSKYTLEQLTTFLRAAKAWEIPVALSSLKAELTRPERLESNALKIYGSCCLLNFPEERKLAARYAIRTDPFTHDRKQDFRDMSALDLLALQDERQRCITAITDVLQAAKLTAVSSACAWHGHANTDISAFRESVTRMLTTSLDPADFGSPRFLATCLWDVVTCRLCIPHDTDARVEARENMLKELEEWVEGIINSVV